MKLLPPKLEDEYLLLDDIMQAINFFIFIQGYTIIKKIHKNK